MKKSGTGNNQTQNGEAKNSAAPASKRRARLLPLLFLALLAVAGARAAFSLLPPSGSAATQGSGQGAEPAFLPKLIGSYEAEDAAWTGNVKAVERASKAGFTGSGYVEGFQEDADSCRFTIEIPADGFYDLNFVSAGGSAGEDRRNYVAADGERLGTVSIDQTSFADSVLERVYLASGSHEIEYSKYWGWVSLDSLKVTESAPIDPGIYRVSARLSNEAASDSAKRLMSYLCDIYGTSFLSGQYCDGGMYGKEFQVIRKATGKTPAVLGLDFIEYSPSRAANGTLSRATEYAVDFWEKGGIVTFCWHWNAPSKYLTGQWYSGFYREYTDIDLAAIMDGRDEEGYALLLEDIAAIAVQLGRLRDADVPILFRPLHEASGGWFWWGAAGPEPYKALYLLLYEKLTGEYGLNNLIWLWNGQSKDWYPGDAYVDIVGEDIYPGEKVYASQISKYLEVAAYADTVKPVYLSENGCVFDPELARRDGAMWGLWCTWGGEFVAKDTAIYTLSEQYTESDMLVKAYSHEAVVTLDELPDLSAYPIRAEAD
ncbi:MAG: beta-mannosidase [Clostridium sp.]|nr:beta-mannosidase [Clostridium sp.]